MYIKSFILLLLLSFPVVGQTTFSESDVEICNSKFKLAVEKDLSAKPINEVVIEIAKSFIGLDYEAKTLEVNDNEKLIVHLTGLDCYTFLETSLVFARCIKQGKTSFEDFQKEVQNIRYRDGKINGYSSRLHYFSDWIYEADRRGFTEDITKSIGGVNYQNNINFMTTHIESYRQLQADSNNVIKMKTIEEEISTREYFYIPQDQIKELEKGINSGDIIGLTSGIKGLDIVHTGMAIRMESGRIHFLHAPITGKKIQITELPLAEYTQQNKHQTGIIVSRPLEP